jgi:hypothetical protein
MISKHTRTVSTRNSIEFEGIIYEICIHETDRSLRGKRVTVCKGSDGNPLIEYAGTNLPYRVTTKHAYRRVENAKKAHLPVKNHPWRGRPRKSVDGEKTAE